jgi:hypothetical protein
MTFDMSTHGSSIADDGARGDAPRNLVGVSTTTRTTPDGGHRLRWWKEALIVGAFYVVYTVVRNQFGSERLTEEGVPNQAFTNALRIMRWENSLNLFVEQRIQDWFLEFPRWIIQFWNSFYGTAHFVVTIGVFIVLFLRRPDVFPLWRNTLAFTTALAIIGFVLFPLMPPRLLDERCPPADFGGECIQTPLRRELGVIDPEDGTWSFGFVDTLAVYGGPWSFDSGGMAQLSNQYAAMPSLHIGWATWCAFAVWPLLRRRASRVLVLSYPAATLFCIIVTANHFWLDGVGGQLTLAAGFGLGWALHVFTQRRRGALQELRPQKL